jgi:hypothetical protein
MEGERERERGRKGGREREREGKINVLIESVGESERVRE